LRWQVWFFLAHSFENLLYFICIDPEVRVFHSSDERPLTKRTKALTVPILILLKVLAIAEEQSQGRDRTWRLLKPTARPLDQFLDG